MYYKIIKVSQKGWIQVAVQLYIMQLLVTSLQVISKDSFPLIKFRYNKLTTYVRFFNEIQTYCYIDQ